MQDTFTSRGKLFAVALFFLAESLGGTARGAITNPDQRYQYKETRELVALVGDAARLVQSRGEAAFEELRRPGSWAWWT